MWGVSLFCRFCWGANLILKKDSHVIWAGIFLLAITLWVIQIFNTNEDFNPIIRDKSELYGVWKYFGSELILKAEGNYSCNGSQCEKICMAGKWLRKDDFYVEFVCAERPSIEWRVIEENNHYQFFQKYRDEISEGEIVFTKQEPLKCKKFIC
jgi:hypothetical protein